jgi:hypothetical protein
MNSRVLQLVWSFVHFFILGVFVLELVVLIGVATYMMSCRRPVGQNDKLLIDTLEQISYQSVWYSLSALVIIYTVLISCLFDVGVPRYRVPTDILIIFMSFLGLHLWLRLLSLSEIVFHNGKVAAQTCPTV